MRNDHTEGRERPRSGRKQTVPDAILRWRAGEYCEWRWQKIADQTVDQRIDKQTKAEREIWERNQAIPISQRRSAIALGTVEDSADDLDALIHKRNRHLKQNQCQARLYEALRSLEDAGYGPSEVGVTRVVTVNRTRPWKAKAALLARGVAWFAAITRKKTGTPIVLSRYRLRRYWDEYKRKNKRLLKTHCN